MLIIDSGYLEFRNFDKAVEGLELEYGYEGMGWEMVKASGDMDVLLDFLESDGINAEVE